MIPTSSTLTFESIVAVIVLLHFMACLIKNIQFLNKVTKSDLDSLDEEESDVETYARARFVFQQVSAIAGINATSILMVGITTIGDFFFIYQIIYVINMIKYFFSKKEKQ